MSDKKTPLLSIHVSVFNLEKYIEQCLESILTQDYDDYELILVDNGSTDRSIEICESYLKKYPDKIKYKKFPLPTRIGRPYVYALSQIKGKYFIAIDGDDYITAGCLKRIAKIINTKKPDVIMGTFENYVESDSSSFRDANFDPQKLNGVPYSEALKYLATVPNFHTVQWRFIVLNDVLKNFNEKANKFAKTYIKLINESTFGDVITVLSILSSSSSMEFMEEPFYVYRSRSSSLSVMNAKNKKAVAFLVGLITIGAWFTEEKKENVRELVYSQLCKFSSLYRNACTTVSEDGYLKMTELIDDYKEAFLKLREYHIAPLTELCDLVNRFGTLQGLIMYTKLQEDNLYNKMHPFRDNNVYVFPVGICGESTLLLLKRWNMKVKGFLDNDSTKEALTFQSYPCMLPDRLKAFSDEQRKNTAAVISTSYEHLIPVLKEQLINLGIPNDQIIVKQ